MYEIANLNGIQIKQIVSSC